MTSHTVSLVDHDGPDSLSHLSQSICATTNLARLIEKAADSLDDDDAIPMVAGMGVLIASLHDLMDRVEFLRKREAAR